MFRNYLYPGLFAYVSECVVTRVIREETRNSEVVISDFYILFEIILLTFYKIHILNCVSGCVNDFL